jgi:hypothetical protein
MSKTSDERGFKFEWERKVAKCRLGAATKAVAAWLSHHANTYGVGARPGVRVLAFETELGESTVRRSLEYLRDLGLIVRVVHGSRAEKRHYADVYRLAIPDDLDTRVRVEDRPSLQQGGQGRGGMANHVRWHVKRGEVSPTCVHCAETQAASADASAGSERSPSGVQAEPDTEGAAGSGPIRPPLGRISDHRSDGSDHRSVEEYQQAFTNKDLTQHSALHRAGPRASSRAAHDEGYRAFVARERAARTYPGEVLTEEDESDLREEIDYDYVEHVLGDLDGLEESTARGMLRNLHPSAVVREIRKMRGEAA